MVSRQLLLASFLLGGSLLARDASAACAIASTPNHICVAFDGTGFTVDTGSGAVERGPITMEEGDTYAFEIDPEPTTPFGDNQFYLTNVTGDAGASVKYTTPTSTGTVNFTPGSATPATIYYESFTHENMGGRITVIGGIPTGSDGGADAAAAGDGGLVSAGGSSGSNTGGGGSLPPGVSTDTSTGPAPKSGCAASPVADGLSSAGGLLAAAFAIACTRRRRAAR